MKNMVMEQRIVEYFLGKAIEINNIVDKAKSKKQHDIASANITLLNEVWDILNQK